MQLILNFSSIKSFVYFPIGLKNTQCDNSVNAESLPSKKVFFNYLYTDSNDTVLRDDWPQCLSTCQQNHSDCSVILTDAECKMFDLSHSQSYGSPIEIDEGKSAFIKLCHSGNSIIGSVSSSLYTTAFSYEYLHFSKPSLDEPLDVHLCSYFHEQHCVTRRDVIQT